MIGITIYFLIGICFVFLTDKKLNNKNMSLEKATLELIDMNDNLAFETEARQKFVLVIAPLLMRLIVVLCWPIFITISICTRITRR